ncbi:hypothetical protein SLEP1_g21079 [Rubroshorea leprosula]|uniref:Succinate dehydrogenase subunit 4 n=1 Tax=Rubroshorea leprosula TaxID=152421 RepID=A0AAV5JA51_9ROSI|nr:hypothetical protein SLEP1_g21079 [Rubroshorea leprosula]
MVSELSKLFIVCRSSLGFVPLIFLHIFCAGQHRVFQSYIGFGFGCYDCCCFFYEFL